MERERGAPEGDTPDVQCACPETGHIERHFDSKSIRFTEGGELPGMVGVSDRLKEALLPLGPTDRSVLELGCGRGALLLALIQAGAGRATGIDLSRATIDAARRRFTEAGLADRADLSVGDAARVHHEAHDWVILDRVICCYPDVEALLANTLPAARRIYAFTVPTSRGWRGVLARLEEWLEDVWNRLLRRPCPGYVHDLDLIERRLEDSGFRLRHQDRLRLWHIAVYERVSA